MKNNKLVLFLAVGIVTNMFGVDYGEEVKIYRKFPNYKMLAISSFMLSMAGTGWALSSADFFKKNSMAKMGVYGLGAVAFIGLAQQYLTYTKKDMPVLILNKEGLWYDGVWFKRNIFCSWDDIKSIKWHKTDSGFFSTIDSLNVYSRSHFPFVIALWDLAITPQEAREIVEAFYKTH